MVMVMVSHLRDVRVVQNVAIDAPFHAPFHVPFHVPFHAKLPVKLPVTWRVRMETLVKI